MNTQIDIHILGEVWAIVWEGGINDTTFIKAVTYHELEDSTHSLLL